MQLKETTRRIDLVSVITPAYNAQEFISATIQSVLNQTYKNWEMIIVDDDSVDDTSKTCQEYSNKDKRIKVLKHDKTLGAGAARNTAIEHAVGDYMAFLDADDVWKTNKLDQQLKFMKQHNTAICFSSYELIDEQGHQLNKIIQALPRLDYNKQLKCNYIGNLTGIYSVKALGKITMPEIQKRQDWVMWLMAIKKAGEAIGMKEVLAQYRVRKNSLSSNKWSLLTYNYNVYRKTLNFSRTKSIICIFKFLFEYVFIKSKQIKTVK